MLYESKFFKGNHKVLIKLGTWGWEKMVKHKEKQRKW